MNIKIGLPVITYEKLFNGQRYEIVPCSHNDKEQEIHLSDEQIIAIVDRYFELKANMVGEKE